MAISVLWPYAHSYTLNQWQFQLKRKNIRFYINIFDRSTKHYYCYFRIIKIPLKMNFYNLPNKKCGNNNQKPRKFHFTIQAKHKPCESMHTYSKRIGVLCADVKFILQVYAYHRVLLFPKIEPKCLA